MLRLGNVVDNHCMKLEIVKTGHVFERKDVQTDCQDGAMCNISLYLLICVRVQILLRKEVQNELLNMASFHPDRSD